MNAENTSKGIATGLLLDVFPLIASHLNYKELKACREVCWSWKDRVDSIFQGRLVPIWQPGFARWSDSLLATDEEFNYYTKIYETNHTAKFLQDMTVIPGGNPFPTCKVVFQALSSTDFKAIKEHEQEFLEILRKFGVSISCLAFITNGNISGNYVSQVLQLVPNLERFDMVTKCYKDDTETRKHCELGELTPFPEKLVSLTISGVNSFLMVNPLLKVFGKQLQHLELDEIGIVCDAFSNPEPILLPALLCFKIGKNYILSGLPPIPKDNRILSHTLANMPSLTMFAFDSLSWVGNPTIEELLCCISTMGSKTMKELHMNFDPSELSEIKRGERMIKLNSSMFFNVHTLGLGKLLLETPIVDKILKTFSRLERLHFFMPQHYVARLYSGKFSHEGLSWRKRKNIVSKMNEESHNIEIAKIKDVFFDEIWPIIPKCSEISVREPVSFKFYWKYSRKQQ